MADAAGTNATLHLTPQERAELGDLDFPESGISYRTHRNVVVLRTGFCMKHGLILKDSIYRFPRRYARFAAIAYGSRLTRRVVPLSSDKTYIAIHNLWSSGYYHWVSEALARLQPVAHLLDRAAVLLPPSGTLHDTMVRSLERMGVRDIEEFPPDANVFVPNLVLPSNPPRHREISHGSIGFIRSRILSDQPARGHGPRRVFISRQRSRARKIVNEDAVADMLARRGYARVFAEELSFDDQVSLMQGAEVVVSQHGAGLTNIVFMRPGASVLELVRQVPPGRGGKTQNSIMPTYPRLAVGTGLHYFCLLCTAADPAQPQETGDIVVDIAGLEQKLRLAEARAARQGGAVTG